MRHRLCPCPLAQAPLPHGCYIPSYPLSHICVHTCTPQALIQQRNREAEALRRLEAEFNEQLAGRQAREAARRAEIDAAAAAVVLAQRRERAAQVIQGYWRGYQVGCVRVVGMWV